MKRALIWSLRLRLSPCCLSARWPGYFSPIARDGTGTPRPCLDARGASGSGILYGLFHRWKPVSLWCGRRYDQGLAHDGQDAAADVVLERPGGTLHLRRHIRRRQRLQCCH
jgi:hypothetical protein